MIIINSAHPYASLIGTISGIIIGLGFIKYDEYTYNKQKYKNYTHDREEVEFDKYLSSLEKQRSKTI